MEEGRTAIEKATGCLYQIYIYLYLLTDFTLINLSIVLCICFYSLVDVMWCVYISATNEQIISLLYCNSYKMLI